MARYSRSGLTLVETIFSTLFISLTVLAIINLFPGAYLSVKKSEAQLQSDLVASSILEEIRATPWTALPSQSLNIGSSLDRVTRKDSATSPSVEFIVYERTGPPFEPQTIDGLTYTPVVLVTDIPDTDANVLRRVRVEVYYQVGARKTLSTEEKGESKQVYETYVHALAR